jgi:hypothetical protein
MRTGRSEVDEGLLAACVEGDVRRVRAALESHADPNVTDARGVTALHRARRSETPKPLVLYRGDEHPLLAWLLQFAPEALGCAVLS